MVQLLWILMVWMLEVFLDVNLKPHLKLLLLQLSEPTVVVVLVCLKNAFGCELGATFEA